MAREQFLVPILIFFFFVDGLEVQIARYVFTHLVLAASPTEAL